VEFIFDHVRSTGEGSLNVPICRLHLRHQIVWAVLSSVGRIFCKPLARINDYVERFKVDINERERVFGDMPAISKYERNRLSDMTDFVLTQDVRVDVEADSAGRHGNRYPIAGHNCTKIGVKQNTANARQSFRRAYINSNDPTVRYWTAQERRVGLAFD
jgi:hypothetical protein